MEFKSPACESLLMVASPSEGSSTAGTSATWSASQFTVPSTSGMIASHFTSSTTGADSSTTGADSSTTGAVSSTTGSTTSTVSSTASSTAGAASTTGSSID